MVSRWKKWAMPLAVALVTSSSTGAGAATPQFGLYAYTPTTWNGDVAKQFPIVFVQYQSWARNSKKINQIRELAASGSRVVVDFEFLKTGGQRSGRAPSRSVNDIMDEAHFLLDPLAGVPLEGITLDEENLASPERLALMSDLYGVLKKTYPNRQFLQWISATTSVEGLRRLNLGTIPADGWVVDPYRLSLSDYAAYIRQMRTFSKRLYSVVWAAPNWQIGGGFRKQADAAWWNDQQWRVFYNRLAVNQANDVPTIFYMFTLKGKAPVSTWMGGACDRSFYLALTQELMPYVRQHKLGLGVPTQRPGWLPAYCPN